MKIWSKSIVSQFLSFRFAFALAAGVLVTSPILAGGKSSCHFHGSKPATEATILTCAEMHKSRLIEKGTIESSWLAIKHDSVQQVDAKEGKKEWRVVFKDAAAKDKTKETLYLFFSIPGNFLASNYSGK